MKLPVFYIDIDLEDDITGMSCISFVEDPAVEVDFMCFEKEKQIGQEMIEAFRKQDYEAFIKNIPAGGKQVWGKDKFNEEQREVASRLGKIDSYRFLTKLELEPAHHLVWAVRFKSYTLKGEETFKEALFSIVVGKVDENLRVFLFGFK